jgi:hypothetical protein
MVLLVTKEDGGVAFWMKGALIKKMSPLKELTSHFRFERLKKGNHHKNDDQREGKGC